MTAHRKTARRWVTIRAHNAMLGAARRDPDRTFMSIAAELGLSPTTVSRHMAKYADLAPRPRGRRRSSPPEAALAARRMHEQQPELSLRAISRQLGMPYTTVRRSLGMTT